MPPELEPRREWRALSVRQPFASLIIAGVKLYEGRSWQPAMPGPIAIHASGALHDLAHEPPVLRALARAGLDLDDLPRSAVIGVATVVEVIDGTVAMRTVARKHRVLVDPLDADTAGMWLWKMADPIAIDPAVIKGALNLWRVPAAIVKRINLTMAE